MRSRHSANSAPDWAESRADHVRPAPPDWSRATSVIRTRIRVIMRIWSASGPALGQMLKKKLRIRASSNLFWATVLMEAEPDLFHESGPTVAVNPAGSSPVWSPGTVGLTVTYPLLLLTTPTIPLPSSQPLSVMETNNMSPEKEAAPNTASPLSHNAPMRSPKRVAFLENINSVHNNGTADRPGKQNATSSPQPRANTSAPSRRPEKAACSLFLLLKM
ncbi:hypothetical protein SKAU_G00239170 [Synaphobranchus kaupii]|uniref:Uncharacterized protein n=1 Tax=Synaphobranchus kaupii TaxID=118154 RepID=A0A9Q1F788_SYNKA|nr:hypothetical protein SKAU_G00239170 [Synaphobranchus kaupii]